MPTQHKICGNCQHSSICKCKDALWEAWHSTWQGRISNKNDPMLKMFIVLAEACGRWEEDTVRQ